MPQPAATAAVITGAASGLGRALAQALHARGYDLALIDVDRDGLEATGALLTGAAKTTFHLADIAEETAVRAAAAAIVQAHPAIGLLLNNAAVSISRYFGELDIQDFERLMQVNFWGTVYCTRYFLPALQQQPRSRVVNIISDFALMGFPGKTAYASSKGAVMAFTHCLQTELAGTATKACLVIPPPMDTGIVRNGLHMDEERKAREEAFLKRHGMPVDKAARVIVQKVLAARPRIVVGPMMFWIDLASRLAPALVQRAISRRKKKIDFV